ncbi:MAG: fimbrial protein [Moraxellaceae bacterium]|nr:fimbrial protein [Moraxellaceae bacterium]
MSVRAHGLSVLLALAALFACGHATAGCISFDGVGTVTFNVPATITVPVNAQVGDVIYNGAKVTPSPVITLYCFNVSDYGVTNQVGTTPAPGTAIYPSGVAGVGYRLVGGSTATDYLYPWGCCQLSQGTRQLNVPVGLQLIKTGTIANGAQLPSGTIARWVYDQIFGGTASEQNFVLGGSVTFASPSCQVNTPNIAVALPKISTSALPVVDGTTATTPFRISLNCSSGATLNIMFSTATTVTGKPTVIRSTGTANGVGVQLTDSSSTPVAFGVERVVGATPNGALDLAFNARYYRTGTVSAGSVNATATFTLSYD